MPIQMNVQSRLDVAAAEAAARSAKRLFGRAAEDISRTFGGTLSKMFDGLDGAEARATIVAMQDEYAKLGVAAENAERAQVRSAALAEAALKKEAETTALATRAQDLYSDALARSNSLGVLNLAQSKELETLRARSVATSVAATRSTTAAADATAAATAAETDRLAAIDAATVAHGRLGTATEEAGSKLTNTGRLLNGGGIASTAMFLGLGAVTTKMAGDFEENMTKLSAAADLPDDQFKAVSDGILQLSGQVGASSDELSSGMFTIQKAGLAGANGAATAAEKLEVLKAAAQGAAVEGAPVGEVVNALTTTLHDFNIPADQAADVMSKMRTASGLAKTNINDFASALHSVEPAAAAAQIKLEDVWGVLAQMTQSGMSPAQAAVDMNQAITSLSRPNDVQAKKMKQLGINPDDIAQNLGSRGISGSMQELYKQIAANQDPSTKLIDTGDLTRNAGALGSLHSMLAMDGAGALSDDAKQRAQSYLDNTKGNRAFTMDIRGMDADNAKKLQQFKELTDQVNSFSSRLAKGRDTLETVNAALGDVTGTSEAATVAFQTTGVNAGDTADRIAEIGKSTADSNKDVSGWSKTNATLNQQMRENKEAFHSAGIELGQSFVPAMKLVAGGMHEVSSFMMEHKGVGDALVGTLGLIAAGWVTIRSAMLVKDGIGVAKDIYGFMRDTALPAVNSLASSWQGLVPAAEEANASLAGAGPAAEAGAAGVGVAAAEEVAAEGEVASAATEADAALAAGGAGGEIGAAGGAGGRFGRLGGKGMRGLMGAGLVAGGVGLESESDSGLGQGLGALSTIAGGALTGSMFGPVGTAVGAGVGAAIAGVTYLLNQNAEAAKQDADAQGELQQQLADSAAAADAMTDAQRSLNDALLNSKGGGIGASGIASVADEIGNLPDKLAGISGVAETIKSIGLTKEQLASQVTGDQGVFDALVTNLQNLGGVGPLVADQFTRIRDAVLGAQDAGKVAGPVMQTLADSMHFGSAADAAAALTTAVQAIPHSVPLKIDAPNVSTVRDMLTDIGVKTHADMDGTVHLDAPLVPAVKDALHAIGVDIHTINGDQLVINVNDQQLGAARGELESFMGYAQNLSVSIPVKADVSGLSNIPSIVNPPVGGGGGNGLFGNPGVLPEHHFGGGVLPGYSPGRDNMLVPLAGGEGIVRPEAVRRYGPGLIHRLNQGFWGGGITPNDPSDGYSLGGTDSAQYGVAAAGPTSKRVAELEEQIRRKNNDIHDLEERQAELKLNAKQSERDKLQHEVENAKADLNKLNGELGQARQGIGTSSRGAGSRGTRSGSGSFGAPLPANFGLDKGLAGMAEWGVDALMNIAAAPALASLGAISDANGGGTGPGGTTGLFGIAAANGMIPGFGGGPGGAAMGPRPLGGGLGSNLIPGARPGDVTGYQGTSTPLDPLGTPKQQEGTGKGFGMSDSLMSGAAGAAGMGMPGAGMAAQIGMQEISRGIQFAGQAIGIGVEGLQQTFLPDLPMGGPIAKGLGGLAGGHPVMSDTADQGQQGQGGYQDKGQGQGGAMTGQSADPLQPGQGGDVNNNQQNGDTVHGNQINGDVHNYDGPQGDPSATLGYQQNMAGQLP